MEPGWTTAAGQGDARAGSRQLQGRDGPVEALEDWRIYHGFFMGYGIQMDSLTNLSLMYCI